MPLPKELLVGMPHLGAIDPEAQVAFFNATLHLQGLGIKCEPRYSEGTYLSTQRNHLAWQALMNGQDLLFIDSDMTFGPTEIDLLFEADKDIIGGLYFARKSTNFPVVYRIVDPRHEKGEIDHDPARKRSQDKHLRKIDRYFTMLPINEIPDEPFTHPDGLGVGTGFLYIKNDVLGSMWNDKLITKFGRPFNMWPLGNGDELKEDLAFCLRAHHAGFEVWCHPGVNLTHLGKQRITKNSHLDNIGRSEYFYSNDIKGWMNFNELNWLYQRAKKMESIVEIGSWKGRSTHALLSGCSGQVTAVDHFRGSPNELKSTHTEAKEGKILEQFLHNCRKFNNLTLEVGDSAQAAQKLYPEDKSVDMVFIDGGHEYAEVKRDLLAWKDKPTKLLCGHDFPFEGIYRAVTEVLGKVRQYETLWYVEMDK